MSRHMITMDRPASWFRDKWRDSLLLGNGLSGALIPGAIAQETITFTRHDLWEGAGEPQQIPDVSAAFRAMRDSIDQGDYAAANHDNMAAALAEEGYQANRETPYPLGQLSMDFQPDANFRHYKRGIDMRLGEAFVDFCIGDVQHHRRAFVSRRHDVFVMRLWADEAFATRFNVSLWYDKSQPKVTTDGLSVTSADGQCAMRIDIRGDFTSRLEDGALAVIGRDYTVIVALSSCGSALPPVPVGDYASLLDDHAALHTPLYDAVSIELAPDGDFALTNQAMLDGAYDDAASPALIERMWRFGRYLFISAANEKGLPVPLYGLWPGKDHLQWSQYVANENVEMTYWHALPGGLGYALPSLIKYYTGKMDVFRTCARQLFGMKGIWISAYTTPNVAGPCIPVSVIVNWISCAGWLSRHFWDYYLYTGDEALLRSDILPFMREAALFYADYAQQVGDVLRLYPSVSPENTPGNLMNADTHSATGHRCPAVENALMDFAVMKELLTHLITGARITGMYADEVSGWVDLVKRIPAYQVNEDGAVKEWLSADLFDNYHHRHLSHLYPVFPGCEVTATSDEALYEAFRQAVALRQLGSQSGWSLTHMANIYARFGQAEQAVNCLDTMFKSVVNDALITTHNDWRGMGMTLDWKEAAVQLDANFGCVNAVQEMLFRWQSDALCVLPALPARMKQGKVTGMRFPEGSIDIAWRQDGQVDITVHAAEPIHTNLFVNNRFIYEITVDANTTGEYHIQANS